MSKTLQPHQQRVVDEKSELDGKIERLAKFIKGTVYPTTDLDEQDRLARQLRAMYGYSEILGERIKNF